MDHRAPDYDQISSTYDSRYRENRLDGIAHALLEVSGKATDGIILEVGCGTGRWLESLGASGATVVGVDASTGMLARASHAFGPAALAAARANQLPFTGRPFRMICCINALHHFDHPNEFIDDAASLLKHHGILAVVAIDPRTIRRRYHYEFFQSAREMDIRRYPSFGQLVDWTCQAGLDHVEMREVDTSTRCFAGEEVLGDPFLKKQSDSTLALLSDEEYATGLRRISEALEASRGSTEPMLFRSEMSFSMITGHYLGDPP
jgi:ubiquinone/menaquinone biosynthesis C-methylase UbiE